jgi:hypothetical protein
MNILPYMLANKAMSRLRHVRGFRRISSLIAIGSALMVLGRAIKHYRDVERESDQEKNREIEV